MTGPARPARIICICGLAAEARVARAAGFEALVGAGDRMRTAAFVQGAVERADLLVSFGIAGGLAPELRAGDVVVSSDIVSAEGARPAAERSKALSARLAQEIGAVEGRVLGAGEIVATAAAKHWAYRETGALAVDLESDIVARIAGAAGIAFLALRAIADAADRDLPPAALVPLAKDGRAQLARVASALLRRPFQAAALMRLARDARTALAALRAPARALHGLDCQARSINAAGAALRNSAFWARHCSPASSGSRNCTVLPE